MWLPKTSIFGKSTSGKMDSSTLTIQLAREYKPNMSKSLSNTVKA